VIKAELRSQLPKLKEYFGGLFFHTKHLAINQDLYAKVYFPDGDPKSQKSLRYAHAVYMKHALSYMDSDPTINRLLDFIAHSTAAKL
jgi:hypothetical protein